jgi:Fic family protein
LLSGSIRHVFGYDPRRQHTDHAGTLALLSELDEFKGAWRALGTLAPERLNALRRVATIESIGSSTRIEGSKLTDREVEHLLAKLEIKSFATRDEQEVAGYAEIMETVFHAWTDIPVNENHIRQLHREVERERSAIAAALPELAIKILDYARATGA